MNTDSIKLDESLQTLKSEIKVEEITITEFQEDPPLSETEFQTENKEKNIKHTLQQDNQIQEKERTSSTQEEYLSSYSNDTLQDVLKSVTTLLQIVKCIQEKQNEESKKNDEKFNDVLKAINVTKDLASQNQLKISTIIANCKGGNTKADCVQFQGADNNYTTEQSTILEDGQHRKEDDNNYSRDNIQSCGVGDGVTELQDGLHCRTDDVQSLLADDTNHDMEFDIDHPCLAGDDNNENTKLKDVQFHEADNRNNHSTEFKDLQYHGDVDNHCSEFKDVHSDGGDNDNLSPQLKDVHPHGVEDNNNSSELKNVRSCRLRPLGAELKDLRSCRLRPRGAAELKDLRSHRENNNFSDISKSDISDGETVTKKIEELQGEIEHSQEISQNVQRAIKKCTYCGKHGGPQLPLTSSTSSPITPLASHEKIEELQGEIEHSQEIRKNVQRPIKKCSYCGKHVKYLSLHLRTHRLQEEEIKLTCHQNRIRKLSKTKHSRKCPMPKCSEAAPYVRLDIHLRTYHKMKTDHPMYRRFVNTYCRRETQKNSIREPDNSTIKTENPASEKLVNTNSSSTKEPVASNEQKEEVEYPQCASKELYIFLQTLDGGKMTEQNARQYRSKISQILSGSSISHEDDFLTDKALIKLCPWFEKYIESHRETSAVFYLSVLIKFLKYLQIKNTSNFQLYEQKILIVKNWKKAFRTAKIAGHKAANDITELEIRSLESSVAFTKCMERLEMIKNGTLDKISFKEHSHIRNILLLLTILRNGCRSCVLTNMTLHELENSEVHERLGIKYFVIFVNNHKTRREHGPARVTVEEKLFENILCYAKKIRPQIVPVDSNVQNVFVTWHGTSINSDNLYKGVLSIWREAGLETHLTTTIIRKIIVTRVHSRDDNETKDEVARHFCHRQSTAERDYKQLTKSSQSVSASLKIYETLYGKDSHDLDSNVSEATSDNFLSNATPTKPSSLCQVSLVRCTSPASNSSESLFHTSESEMEEILQDNIVPPGFSSNNTDLSPMKSLPYDIKKQDRENKKNVCNSFPKFEMASLRGRCFFTPKERKLINIVFGKFLKESMVPGLETIRRTLETDIRLKVLKKSNKDIPVKIKGCLQGLYNKVGREI